MDSLKTALKNWLHENGFDVAVDFAEDSSYDITNIVINLGTKSYPDVGRYFEQYLYEYGLEYTGIFDSVLQFLHELGHHMTINNFTQEELLVCHLTKQFMNSEDEHDWFNKYWSLADEFAANMWEINFINSNIEVVEELCNIFIRECV